MKRLIRDRRSCCKFAIAFFNAILKIFHKSILVHLEKEITKKISYY
ncbi:hypothetical protein [Fusobacterium nucleatum]